jgi:hypothetical protein
MRPKILDRTRIMDFTVADLTFAPCTRELVPAAAECINDAFMADYFFKKPQYKERVTVQGT